MLSSHIFHDFRNSSFFYWMFMVKNVLEILFAIIFVFFNTSWLWAYDFSENDDPGICNIDLLRNNVRKNYFGQKICEN